MSLASKCQLQGHEKHEEVLPTILELDSFFSEGTFEVTGRINVADGKCNAGICATPVAQCSVSSGQNGTLVASGCFGEP